MHEAPSLGRIVEWARKGICPWRKARKIAVKEWRDGAPIEWIARAMRISDQWVRRWVDRFVQGGKTWAALADRSSRPHRIRFKRTDADVEAVKDAKAAFPHLGALKLKIVAGLRLGHDTVHRILRELRMVVVRKKAWYQYRRFQRPFPNYLWQFDFKEFRRTDGSKVWAANLIDDHSRFLLSSRCLGQCPTMADAIAVVQAAIRLWGRPKQILTDRGAQFTSEQSDDPSLFTLTLDAWGIRHIKARSHHPQTCGKIERWHGSLNREWFAYQLQPSTLEEAQNLMDRWLVHYNTVRPHQALAYRVPVEVYSAGLTMEEDLLRLVNEVPG